MSENTITIPVSRFEELIDLETRVNVAVERIYHQGCVGTEDLLWILGTELAVSMAKKMCDEREQEFETFRKNLENEGIVPCMKKD